MVDAPASGPVESTRHVPSKLTSHVASALSADAIAGASRSAPARASAAVVIIGFPLEVRDRVTAGGRQGVATWSRVTKSSGHGWPQTLMPFPLPTGDTPASTSSEVKTVIV